MLQLLGACLILVGSFGFSCLFIENDKKKLRSLDHWEKILQMFQSEIAYKKQPLIFAIEEIAEKMSGEEKNYLENVRNRMEENPAASFLQIWSEEGKNYAKREKMSPEEIGLIQELGVMTGFEDEKLQVKFMKEQERKWQEVKREKQKEYQERKKLVWTLGGSMGTVLILLLW